MKKLMVLFGLIVLTTACVSTAKYNAHIDDEVSVEALRKDVVFAKKVLLKKHVDIDWYVPKDQIVFRLDSFKNSLQQAMRPNDFSMQFSKVIATFGHGHTHLSTLNKKQTKEEYKRYKKTKNPLNYISFKSFNDRIMIDENFWNDSMLPTKVELLAVNGLKYSDFYTHTKGMRAGDGFIKTLEPHIFSRTYKGYLNREIGMVDSVTLALKKGDSLFTHILRRDFPKEKSRDLEQDSLKVVKKSPPVHLTKAERSQLKKEKKDQLKKLNKQKQYYGYNTTLKEYARRITFPNQNDSTIAVLKIKDFTSGNAKKGYPAIFDSIQQLGIEHLILDLRSNGGGFPAHINELYSFLTTSDKPIAVTADEVKVRSKTVMFSQYYNPINVVGHTVLLPFVLYGSSKALVNTHKKPDNNYYYKINFKKDFRQRANTFRGDVYVLTDGLSYSASSIVSAALQNEGKAVFVGEETGGDYNGTVAGAINSYTMPHSKIDVRFGLMTFRPNTDRDLKGRGVMPDIQMTPNFEDWLKGKDNEVDWVLKAIEAKKKMGLEK